MVVRARRLKLCAIAQSAILMPDRTTVNQAAKARAAGGGSRSGGTDAGTMWLEEKRFGFLCSSIGITITMLTRQL
jgi:hypothetical protein